MAKSDPKLESLRKANESLCGHSPYALLDDLVRLAQTNFGFDGTMEEAQLLLCESGQFEVVVDESINDCRVRRITN